MRPANRRLRRGNERPALRELPQFRGMAQNTRRSPAMIKRYATIPSLRPASELCTDKLDRPMRERPDLPEYQMIVLTDLLARQGTLLMCLPRLILC